MSQQSKEFFTAISPVFEALDESQLESVSGGSQESGINKAESHANQHALDNASVLSYTADRSKPMCSG